MLEGGTMSTRRKFFIAFCFIILNAFLLVGFLVIRDATSINKLKKEVGELTKLNVLEDRYNRPIKTKGGYAIVEKAIKEYLDDYAVSVQGINELIHDPQLAKVLSYDNYLEDGPDFQNSIAYLETSKKTFNDEMDDLLKDLEEEQIMENIYKRTDDPYYIALYEELMFDGDMTADLKKSQEMFLKTQERMNGLYDTSLNVLNFLITYNGQWKLEDGQIKFETQELLNYYNDLIAKVQEKKDD